MAVLGGALSDATPQSNSRAEAPDTLLERFSAPEACRLEVSVTYSAGDPAENVEIALIQKPGGSVLEPAADPKRWTLPTAVAPRCSDAQGQVSFEGLTPGGWQVRTDRGQAVELELEPGESRQLEIRLGEGLLVLGQVVDPTGRSVAGAQLWLTTDRGDALAGRAVGESDIQGRFRLRDVPQLQSLGAFAGGYGPSELVDLELCQPVEGQVEVLLKLVAGGAQLTGRVLTRDGGPIAGAELAWGHPSRHTYVRPDGTEIEAWGPRLTRSRGDGSYALSGLPAETNQLSLRATGYGLKRLELSLVGGSRVTQDFVLEPGVVLRGRVQDETGAPVANARVCALEEALMTSFLGVGQIEYARVFGYAQTRSAADGSYLLGPLNASQRHLYAFAPGEPGSPGAICRAEGLLGLEAGAEPEWNPVLARGLCVVGRVEFADGQPAPDQFVELSDESGGQQYLFQTDAQGRFEFLNLPAGPFTLLCRALGGPEGSQPARLAGLAPGDEPRVLRFDFSASGDLATGRVSGQVVDRGQRLGPASGSGNPAADSAPPLAASLDSGGWQSQAVEWSGLDFVFPRVTPGRWRVLLSLRGSPIGASDWFELAPGQELDLGPIATEPGGQLALLLARPGVTAERPLKLLLTHAQGYQQQPLGIAPGEVQVSVPNLNPGQWQGLIKGEQVLPVSFEFALLPSGQSQVELTLAPGADCSFSLAGKLKVQHTGWRLEILSADGALLFSELLEPPGVLNRNRLSTCLAPGSYTARWTAATGGSVQEAIVVEHLSPQSWVCSGP